jgi:hypothetical protein
MVILLTSHSKELNGSVMYDQTTKHSWGHKAIVIYRKAILRNEKIYFILVHFISETFKLFPTTNGEQKVENQFFFTVLGRVYKNAGNFNAVFTVFFWKLPALIRKMSVSYFQAESSLRELKL